MKGNISDNILFKSLPKLLQHTYQGSLGSTSEGILYKFKCARRILEKENEDNLSNIISLVYFEGIDLADHSPNNPLKVLHPEIEYDSNKGRKKIAFVGILNCPLDALKMNKGLYLSVPQLNLEDLKYTGQTIAESYNIKLSKEHKDLFEDLAITYREYKDELMRYYFYLLEYYY